MPIVYNGTLKVDEKEFTLRVILTKDIKINIYKKTDAPDFQALLSKGASEIKGMTAKPSYDLIGSYVSLIKKDTEKKEFKREIYLYGDVTYANKIMEMANHSFLPSEELSRDSYPSHLGIVTNINYRKVLTSSEIVTNLQEINSLMSSLIVTESSPKNNYLLQLYKSDKNGKVELTPGINYHKSVFDVGDIVDNAIHSQVRSIQHLRSIKNLDWIDKAIENGDMEIIDDLESLKAKVSEAVASLRATGERKVYYDTEGSGLKVFNLPCDHEEFDILSTHIITWVTKRRADGFPLKKKTIAIPVGMKYCDNIDEVEAIEILKPLLANPEFGVVSHNSDFETQICLRYSEIEKQLSYREYYKWKKKLSLNDSAVDKEYIESEIVKLEKQLEEEKTKSTGMMARIKTLPLQKKIEELKSKLDVNAELERVRNLPKEEKPYLSKIQGEDIFRVNIRYDTLVLSRMANNGILLRHDLKTLTDHYLHLDQLSLDDVFGNSQSSQYKIYDFSLLPREFMLYYACPDTYLLPDVEWHLERQAYNNMIFMGHDEKASINANIELLNLYYKVDVPFAKHMAEFANYKGVAIERDKLDKERYEMNEAVELILGLLTKLTGEEDISWSSTRQVGTLIFTKYKYPIISRTEKDNEPQYNKRARKFHISQTKEKFAPEYATVVDIPEMTEDLLSSGGQVILSKKIVNSMKCPLSYIYQEYMNRFKDLTSFTQMIYDRSFLVNGEWIYFPNYKSTSTDTGRASGGIMIMKADKKSMFKARKGHVMLGGDLDQAELRLIATMSQDLADIQDFKNPRYDPHTKTAAQVNNVPIDEVTGDMRSGAKVINFGYFYGMQEKATAENIHKDMVIVPESLIMQVKMLLLEFARANKIKVSWLTNLRATVQKVGFSKTPMGRYKWFPEIKKEGVEKWELARVGRQGGNVPIQGLCADFIKERIVMIYEVIKECKISRYFTQPIFVHDEYHSEVSEEAFKYAKNDIYTPERVKYEQQFNLLWLYELMYSSFTEKPLGFTYLKDEAPMTMGIGLGRNWKESKSDLHGLPQELQREIIKKYRNNEIDNETFQGLCDKPVETFLHIIRTWWANETYKEVSKITDINAPLPENVGHMIADMFVQRGLKDIFGPTKDEKKEWDAKGYDFLSRIVGKALNYLNGKEVEFAVKLESDKLEIQDNDEMAEETWEAEIIDFQAFKKSKEEFEQKYLENQYEYDVIFKESRLLELGKLMIYESNKTLEINIDGMFSSSVVALEKLIRMNHSDDNKYKVVVIAQKPMDVTPYKVTPTTYLINPNEDLLLKIKNIFDQDKKKELEFYKNLA